MALTPTAPRACLQAARLALQQPAFAAIPTFAPPSTRRFASWRPNAGGYNKPANKKPNQGAATIKRFVPHEASKFFMKDGQLITTPENVEFFRRYPNLDPDNGKLKPLRGGPELYEMGSRYGIKVAFSPRHILHPHHLVYFNPRGHPLMPSMRAKYARKTMDEPMWAISMGYMTGSAVVSMLPRRMIKGSVFRRLEELGYTNGVAEGKEIRGTLWLMLQDPLKAAQHEAEPFGRVVADILDQKYSQRTD